MKALTAAFIIVLCVSFASLGWLYFTFVNRPNNPADNKSVTVEVRPEMSTTAVIRQLKNLGVISSVWKMRLYARMLGPRGLARVGEYAVSPSMTPGRILSILHSGKSIVYPFTVPEGYNIWQIADLWAEKQFGSKKEFLQLCHDHAFIQKLLHENEPSLEGYLFPETYDITRFTTAKQLIGMMVGRFFKEWATLAPQVPKNMTQYQIVTLASIIEKETGDPAERPLVASVFYNRLKKGMRLQTDPTVLYGIWDQTGIMRMDITRKDLITPDRYNTYTFAGLPYGPISNPGLASLTAAIHPAHTTYLYFVSRNDGTHVFSTDYRDQEKMVRKYQLNPRARQGKSWRDLRIKQTGSR